MDEDGHRVAKVGEDTYVIDVGTGYEVGLRVAHAPHSWPAASMCAMASSACFGPAAQPYLPVQARTASASARTDALRVPRFSCRRTTSAEPSCVVAAGVGGQRVHRRDQASAPRRWLPAAARRALAFAFRCRRLMLRAATEVATVHVSRSAECCNHCMAAWLRKCLRSISAARLTTVANVAAMRESSVCFCRNGSFRVVNPTCLYFKCLVPAPPPP